MGININVIDVSKKYNNEEDRYRDVMIMFKKIEEALGQIPNNSLGREEIRYMAFTGTETLPSGYERANGQRGTYAVENGNVNVIPIQKVK